MNMCNKIQSMACTCQLVQSSKLLRESFDITSSHQRSNFYNMKSFTCYMKRDEIYHEEAPVLTGSAKFMNYFRPLIGSA